VRAGQSAEIAKPATQNPIVAARVAREKSEIRSCRNSRWPSEPDGAIGSPDSDGQRTCSGPLSFEQFMV
jgi:hypothetical protein